LPAGVVEELLLALLGVAEQLHQDAGRLLGLGLDVAGLVAGAVRRLENRR
jgi:hypothetical protein